MHNFEVIQAAGGLLWKDDSAGKKIAIIHRARHQDWTLPKGKLNPGERWQNAALREVKEETGCEAQLKSFAGSFSYLINDAPKIVLFWNMALVEEGQFKPTEEVDQLLWLVAEEAIKKLDYFSEKNLIKNNFSTAKKYSSHCPSH